MNEIIPAGDSPATHVPSLLFNASAMQALTAFGEMMARSAVTIPKHLQGKPADCTAIALQATQWGMNPFAVAQKTHVTQGGALGYEAQLVNAVIVNSGALTGRPEYEFIGDWSKILGKVQERTGNSGGKYYVAAWKQEDEAGLGIVVSATLRGEQNPRSITVMMSQAYPRFSTQWATDPQQQICYLALRKFARRYVPDTILGVYTVDEFDGQTFDVDPVTGAATPAPSPAPAPFNVQRKPKTPAPPADVVDADSGEEEKSAPTPAQPDPVTPRSAAPQEGDEKIVGAGEIAFLKKKAAGLEIDLDKRLADMGGLVLDRLTKADFDRVKAEINKVAG